MQKHHRGDTAGDKLPEVRKASKRVRYVAESLVPLLGRRAKRVTHAVEAETAASAVDRADFPRVLRAAERKVTRAWTR